MENKSKKKLYGSFVNCFSLLKAVKSATAQVFLHKDFCIDLSRRGPKLVAATHNAYVVQATTGNV